MDTVIDASAFTPANYSLKFLHVRSEPFLSSHIQLNYMINIALYYKMQHSMIKAK